MVHAVVSVENERYFEDPGWDPIAIVRAFLQNITSGGVVSGASTITQEVARNLVLQDTTVSPERKLQEIVVAAEIARQYDKNFILQLYLNEIFFGNQSYGVEAASQFYFGHSAADLNLPEAAMLAGLIQAPATYDPVINRQAAFDRMESVLKQMAAVGCLQFSFAPYDKQPLLRHPGGHHFAAHRSAKSAGRDAQLSAAHRSRSSTRTSSTSSSSRSKTLRHERDVPARLRDQDDADPAHSGRGAERARSAGQGAGDQRRQYRRGHGDRPA